MTKRCKHIEKIVNLIRLFLLSSSLMLSRVILNTFRFINAPIPEEIGPLNEADNVMIRENTVPAMLGGIIFVTRIDIGIAENAVSRNVKNIVLPIR